MCNEGTPQIKGALNIFRMLDIPTTVDSSQSFFLLNAHLNWEGRSLSKNYGFDIANELRTKIKSKTPIVIYSPIRVEYFVEKSKSEIKYKVLFGRGSSFLEVPFKETDLIKLTESITPLSNAALHDVATMLCNLKGIVIDKLNHDLKFGADIDKIIGTVTPYLSEYQEREIKLDKFTANIKAAKKQDDFNALKLQFITLCNQELTEKGKEKPQVRKKKHKILVLDDLQEEINKAKENLKSQFLIEGTATGEEAIAILKKDVKNEIVAVIADWRLFTDAKQTYWQQLQGYEVLDFAAKNGIRSLFALTSQADFIVHHLRNLIGIRFAMFKKENLNTPDQWKVFADVLFEACESAVSLRADMPKSKQWTNVVDGKSYKQLYSEMWNADNRDEILLSVAEKSNEIWNYIIEEKKHNFKYIELIKDKFDIEIPKKELDLFPVLVLRRIWMALWYLRVDNLNRMSRESVTETVNWVYQVVCTGMNNNYDGNHANVEQNKLSLLTREIQNKKLLPEEKDWLIRQNLI